MFYFFVFIHVLSWKAEVRRDMKAGAAASFERKLRLASANHSEFTFLSVCRTRQSTVSSLQIGCAAASEVFLSDVSSDL